MTFNGYEDPRRAEAYATLELAGTYSLGFRDLPALLQKYARGRRAMDFGCGTGRSTRFLRELGYTVTGVDISPDMLRLAKESDPAGDYHLIPGDNLSAFADGSFDVILAAYPFDNTPQSHKASILESLQRRLAPSGVFVLLGSTPEIYVNEWASFSTREFLEANRRARTGDVVRIVTNDFADARPVEDVLCTDESWRALFADAGLRVAETVYPLATGDEPWAWKSEMTTPAWVIYVLTR